MSPCGSAWSWPGGCEPQALGSKHQRACALLVRRLALKDEEPLRDDGSHLGLADFGAYLTD